MTIAPFVVSSRTVNCPSPGLALVLPRAATERHTAVRVRIERLLSAIAIAIQRLLRLVQPLPFPLEFGRRGLVPLAFLERRFAREAAVILEAIRVEPPHLHRRGDGAAWFPRVRAVAEPAAVREMGDVVERRRDGVAVGPRLQFAHARRVDQQRAARQDDELPRGRRMPAAALFVDRARRGGPERVASEKTIDDRRFAGAR